jgi:UDP-galactopyranose mutase
MPTSRYTARAPAATAAEFPVTSNYDYLIVGSGLFGAVFAQQAIAAGRRVLVVEKRRHIGGNCWSEEHEDTGIIVHRYGTHVFHTPNRAIWEYVNRYSAFTGYRHRVLTTHAGGVYSMPINLGTINAFFGKQLRPGEVTAFLAAERGQIAAPANLEEKAISLVGERLYRAFIAGYTEKQWGRSPRDLPASIITRLPVRTSYDDSYFDDRYQGLPAEGYTPLLERLLAGADVELGVDFLADREYWRGRARRLVYTGAIDAYFGWCHGRLNWRSVRFETDVLPQADYQGAAVMNYADLDVPYTRIHEPKHLHPERGARADTTVIVREYAQIDNDAPYYPVGTAADQALLEQYQALAAAEPGVRMGGRLAQYKYFDMHHVIAQALKAAREELA